MDFRRHGHRKLRTRLPNPDYLRHVSCIYWYKWRDAAPRSRPFAQAVAFQRLLLNSRVPPPGHCPPRHPSCNSRGFAEEVSNVGPRNHFCFPLFCPNCPIPLLFFPSYPIPTLPRLKSSLGLTSWFSFSFSFFFRFLGFLGA